MKKLVDKNSSVLRETAQDVPVDSITSNEIQGIIKDMIDALAPHKDGVAIAAPQIGIPLRIFIVSGHIFDEEAFADNDKSKSKTKDLVFINPKIIKKSKKSSLMHEGCLSIRWLYGEVRRAHKVTLKGYNEKGEPVTRGAKGLLSQIFQHETDHLNGVLFSDKAHNLHETEPE